MKSASLPVDVPHGHRLPEQGRSPRLMKRFTSGRDLKLAACLVALAQSLSAVEWQAGPGFRSAELPVPAAGETGFTPPPPPTTRIFLFYHPSPEPLLTQFIHLQFAG